MKKNEVTAATVTDDDSREEARVRCAAEINARRAAMKYRGTTTTGKQFVAETLEECVKGITETAGVKDPVLYTRSNGTTLVYVSKQILMADCAQHFYDDDLELWVARVVEEKS